MEKLPKDLKMEILLHLPIKSLLRLKCVSKSWRSLISEPYLAELHFQRRSSQHTHRFPYLVDTDNLHHHQQMRSIDINASIYDDFDTVNLNFLVSSDDVVKIRGSCRGFLLLLHPKKQQFVLWNPSTSESKHIPFPLPHLYFELFGFCYNESTGDYLIVLASHMNLDPPSSSSDNAVLGFQVFSVKANSWEKLALNCPLAIHIRFSPGVGSVVNGVVVHWLVYFLKTTPEHPQHGMKILAFDFKTKSLRQVPEPDDDDVGLGSCFLRVFGESLTLCDCNNSEIKVWVMKEHGVKSSWTKLMFISIHSGDLRNSSYYSFSPLWLTKDGELVTVHYDGGFRSVTLSKWSSEKGELLECCRQNYQQADGMNDYWENATIYTETLLSLHY